MFAAPWNKNRLNTNINYCQGNHHKKRKRWKWLPTRFIVFFHSITKKVMCLRFSKQRWSSCVIIAAIFNYWINQMCEVSPFSKERAALDKLRKGSGSILDLVLTQIRDSHYGLSRSLSFAFLLTAADLQSLVSPCKKFMKWCSKDKFSCNNMIM